MNLQAPAPADLNDTDAEKQSSARLIDHILERYHQIHRQQLPELIGLARRLEQQYATYPFCPVGLADHLQILLRDLESHMQKEEKILFPMLLQGHTTRAIGPINVMRFEHDTHEASLQRLNQITHNKMAPELYQHRQALYLKLSIFEQDLKRHIHLENDILFPRAEQWGSDGQSAVPF